MWRDVRHQLADYSKRISWVLLACGLLGCYGPAPAAQAQASSVSYKGLTLTPAILNIDLAAGQNQAAFDIQVVNNTKDPKNLRLSTIDFKSLNESGGVAFVNNQASQLGDQHGLASWLNLGNTTVDLAAGQVKTVHLSVENRSDLAPGGHYAAVLFQSTHDQTAGGTNRVAVNEVVSALVFVRKLDGANFGIDITAAPGVTSWWHLPNTFNTVFKNTGNTQEVPRGLVTISGPLSSEVAQGIINPDSNLLLPDSSRLFQVGLTRTHHAWWPGLYRAHISYRYDGSNNVQEAETSFLYVNLLSLIGLTVVALGVYYVIRKRRRLYRRFKKLRKH